ncbi:MAG: outer membrane protein assembly factor BamA [Rhodobacteraceae bacterium]|nr:outer membrane protein assembly factor BamA [Paracoccaceae bacterium]
MVAKTLGVHMMRGVYQGCRLGAVVLVVSAGSALIAPRMDWAEAQSVPPIIVEGNQRIGSETIASIAALPVGEQATPGQINRAVQNLYESGLFENVEARIRGGQILFVVEEWPTINRIAVEGNRRIKDEDLLPLLGSVPRRAYSPNQAEADAAVISGAYAAAGRLAADVTPRIIRRSDNRVDLVFEVREGRVVEVNRLNFTGNRVYSDWRLRRVIDTKQAGIFRILVRRDTFIPERVEFDRQKLREFYLNRGFVDADVISTSADLQRERGGFALNFHIREGQRYRFGDLTITSPEPEIDPEAFHRELRIRANSYYDPRKVNVTLERLDNLAADLGYNFIQARPRVTRNDDDLTINIEFELVRGPRLFIERINIEGNSHTLDRVIRREFDIVEGDPFNARKMQQAADRIRALGYFSRVDVESREGSRPGSVIIDVNVEEITTGTLGFGVSFGTDEGLSGNITLSEQNFLGRGQQLAFALSTASENRRFSFSFTEPKLFDRDLLGGFDIYYRESDFDDTRYKLTQIGLTPRVGFPIGEYSSLEVRYFLEHSDIELDEAPSPFFRDDAGARMASGIGFIYTYDRRNSPIEPTAGFILSADQLVTGLGGDSKYFRTLANAKGYTSFFNEELILSAELEGGLIKSFGSGVTRVSDRFLIGGNSFRGFEFAGIGPRDPNLDTPLGGNIYAIGRFEASFPIGLPEEYGIFGGVFMDVGSAWDMDMRVAPDGTRVAASENFALRSSIGVSIFWDTVIGPLRFNFAKPIRYLEGIDKTENFNFTVSARF